MQDPGPYSPTRDNRRVAQRPGHDQVMLAALAAPLAPEAGPEFIRDDTVPPPGWYWKPEGGTDWQWLGRNTLAAARRLTELHVAAANR